MATIGVSRFKYWCILAISLVLCIIAIGIPVCYFHYTRVYSDGNVNFYLVTACGICLFLFVMVLFRGAEMPIKVSFSGNSIDVDTRCLFWETHTVVPYEEAEFRTSGNQRNVSLCYGSKEARFDPLLWSRKDIQRIVNEMIRHNVKVTVSH